MAAGRAVSLVRERGEHERTDGVWNERDVLATTGERTGQVADAVRGLLQTAASLTLCRGT